MSTTIMLRRGNSAEWLVANPVLAAGEPGYETDTGKFKMGNGVLTWSALEYFLPESELLAAIDVAIADANLADGGILASQALTLHILDANPHPAYDDGPSLALLYQNAKV